MKVSEIMASVVHTVSKQQSLQKVAKIMKDHDIGCVVVGTKNQLEGMITDRDIVCQAVASGKPLGQMTAGDVMTADPVWCSDDDTVKQAALIMEHNQVRRLPVFDYEKHLVGIVSLGDICVHAPQELTAELIREVSRTEHRGLVETA